MLPVVFHNLRGYDSHHILRYAAKDFTNWRWSCIPQSVERFQSVTINIADDDDAVPIRFIDSLQFLNDSLCNLASMLTAEQKQQTNSLPYSDEVRSGKGVFPYSFITSQQVLEEPRNQLPSMDIAFLMF